MAESTIVVHGTKLANIGVSKVRTFSSGFHHLVQGILVRSIKTVDVQVELVRPIECGYTQTGGGVVVIRAPDRGEVGTPHHE